jgi:hypothetical protein
MLGWVGSKVGKNCFVFDLILHTTHTVIACALTNILPSLSLIDTTYFRPDTKATSASVQGVFVDFQIDMDSASPQTWETCTQPPIQWEPGALSQG